MREEEGKRILRPNLTAIETEKERDSTIKVTEINLKKFSSNRKRVTIEKAEN